MELRVGEVVVGLVRLAALDGDPGDAVTDPELQVAALVRGSASTARPTRRPRAGVALEHVDPGGVGVEQAARLVDGLLEDRVGVADRGDVGGDLADGPFGVGAARDLLARPAQLLDEPGVLDRDDGLVGERLHQRRVLVVVGVARGWRATLITPSSPSSVKSGAATAAWRPSPGRSRPTPARGRTGRRSGSRRSRLRAGGRWPAPLIPRSAGMPSRVPRPGRARSAFTGCVGRGG